VIPQRIFQTWRSPSVPTRWLRMQHSWRRHHPGWDYRLWTDDDNHAFIAQHYPRFLPLYDAYPEPIMRVDAVRYFWMFHFGGLYADLDMECVRPFEPLLTRRQLVLGLEPDAHVEPWVRQEGFRRIVCNAVIASVPGHPFWPHLFKMMRESQESTVLNRTGPFLLTRALASFPQRQLITVLEPAAFYPINKFEFELGLADPERPGRRLPPETYALHHWNGGWWRSAEG
jgi:mannosyltransferase OCH1-like enzyme